MDSSHSLTLERTLKSALDTRIQVARKIQNKKNMENSHPSTWEPEQIRQYVEQHGKDVGIHMRYLELLEESGEDEALQVHREWMADSLVCPPEFWRNWVTDQVAQIERDGAEAVLRLSRRAVNECPDVNLWLDYLELVQQLVDDDRQTDEELRRTFEDAITAVGIDMVYGPAIWKRYREFEQDQYAELRDTDATTDALQEAKARIIKLYRRQLSVPLVGNEEVLRELDTVTSEICTVDDLRTLDPETLQNLYTKAITEVQFEPH